MSYLLRSMGIFGQRLQASLGSDAVAQGGRTALARKMTAEGLVAATNGLLPLEAARRYMVYREVTFGFVVFMGVGAVLGGLVVPLIGPAWPEWPVALVFFGAMAGFIVAWQVAWKRGPKQPGRASNLR